MPESIGEAFVRIRPETGTFRAETTSAVTKDLKATEREISRFSRGAIYGSGALHGFGRAALYASSTLVGGASLTYAIRKSVEAAKDSQVVQAQLTNAVRASGIQYGIYRAEINRALEATRDLGFTSDETGRSYASLIRATGNVTKATKDQALAANIARATNRSLEQATRAVAQAEAGRAGALQRLVPGLEKTKNAQKSLAEATRITAGAADKYARTFAGSQDRLNSAISETEVTIGRALIPTITGLNTKLSDWLNKSGQQERIQRDVNEAVKDGEKVIGALASGFDKLKEPVKAVNKLTGGFEHTLGLLGGLYILRKFGLLDLAIKSLGVSFGTVSASAATASAASISSMGAMTAAAVADANTIKLAFSSLPLGTTATGPLSGPSGGGPTGAVPVTATPGLSPFAGIAVVLAGGYPDSTPISTRKNEINIIGKNLKVGQILTFRNGSRWKITRDLGRGNYAAVPAENPTGASIFDLPKRGDVGRTGISVPGSVSGAAQIGIGNLNALERNRIALGTAASTPSTADDLRLLRIQHGLLAQNIATETERLKNAPNRKAAKRFADNLANLQGQDNAALAQIQAIEEEAARVARDRAARIKAAAKASASARARAQAEAFANLLSNANEQIKQYAAITKAREAAAKAAKAAAAKARETRLELQEGALGLARQAADLALTRAGTDQKLIDRATSLERKADQRLIAFYKHRIAETKGLERQDYQGKLLSAQADLAGLKKGKAAGSSFTLAQLYQEAESEFKLYGSNYGPRGTALSPQDQRAAYSNTVSQKRKGNITVIQNFHAPTQVSAALFNANAAARALN